MEYVNKNCIGCSYCKYICPTNAITMLKRFGLSFAIIDEKKCINCGKCERGCLLNVQNNGFKVKNAYCVWAKDLNDVKKSSSGAVFFTIAKKWINSGGSVVGAVYDDNFKSVRHSITNTASDLDQFRGSKYVQSYIDNDLIQKIRKTIKKGHKVLFSGTPCQCAALGKIFGHEHLTLIEVICNGVAASTALEKQVDFLEQKHCSKIIAFSMRGKLNSYLPLYLSVDFENGESEVQPFYDTFFGKLYASRLIIMPECFNCKFKGDRRNADLTIGDYHAFPLCEERRICSMGASTVLVNSVKGFDLLKLIEKDVSMIQASNLTEVYKANNRIIISGFHPRLMDCEKTERMLFNNKHAEALKIADLYLSKPVSYFRKGIEKLCEMRTLAKL